MEEKHIILKTLVGSRAHGLADEDSDYDYRGVFVTPTADLLKLGAKYKANSWFEGKEDQTMYELGHFLHLATKCNPSILEVFKSPIIGQLEQYNGYSQFVDYNKNQDDKFEWGACYYLGSALRDLFHYVWNPNDAFNASTGYSNNQRKSFWRRRTIVAQNLHVPICVPFITWSNYYQKEHSPLTYLIIHHSMLI